MKLAIRIFALTMVFAGAAAASVSSSNSRVLASHQSATGTFPTPNSLPAPACGPHIPGCTPSLNGK
jgi:hypothetical protein